MNEMIIGMSPAMTIEQVIERRNQMVDFVRKSLQENIDYGKVPGTDKNTLFKAGAEKLNTFFAFVPKFVSVRTVEDWTGIDHGDEPFFYYHEKCQLLRDGVVVGEGDGSCNSWEKKYRFRMSQRVCPNCGKPTIFKSRNPGEGYYCWTKKDGCGAKFEENAPAIVSQAAGQVANPDIFDQVNTLLKMSQKRALVAATLLACNASEFFTQDVDDWAIDADFKVVESALTGTGTQAEPTNAAAASARTDTRSTEPIGAPTQPTARAEAVSSGQSDREPRPQRAAQTSSSKRQPPLSPVQRNKLTELYRILYGDAEDVVVTAGLNKLFLDNFKVAFQDASYENGARMTGILLTELRAKTNVTA